MYDLISGWSIRCLMQWLIDVSASLPSLSISYPLLGDGSPLCGVMSGEERRGTWFLGYTGTEAQSLNYFVCLFVLTVQTGLRAVTCCSPSLSLCLCVTQQSAVQCSHMLQPLIVMSYQLVSVLQCCSVAVSCEL